MNEEYPKLISYYEKNYIRYSPSSPIQFLGEKLVNIEVYNEEEETEKREEVEQLKNFIRWSKSSVT